MRMLEKIKYNREIHKHIECVICIKEFEDGESLQ